MVKHEQAQILKLPAQSYVYVIGAADGPQKIGISDTPQSRLTTLRAQAAQDLVLGFAMPVPRDMRHEVERYAHWLLREHHARGEWFSVSPKLAQETVEQAVLAVTSGDCAPPCGFTGKGRKTLSPTGARRSDAENAAAYRKRRRAAGSDRVDLMLTPDARRALDAVKVEPTESDTRAINRVLIEAAEPGTS